MSIQDYDTLKSAIQTWVARRDTNFTGQIPTFVAMAEERMYHGSGKDGEPTYTAPIRSRVLDSSTSLTVTDGVATIPDNCLDITKVYPKGARGGMEYLPPERFEIAQANVFGSDALYYTVLGSSLLVHPSPAEIDLEYVIRHPAITQTVPTGPLIIAHGLIYLECCLFEAFSFERNVELALGHLAKARAMIDGVNRQASMARFAGRLSVKVRRHIP